MRNIELRHLQCFVTLAEELNFARAANRLHISQPPLTRLIRRLEETIGVPLFLRTTRRVELTGAGEAYLPEARAVLEQVKKGIQHAQRAARGEVGEFVIAVEALSVSDVISKSIRVFRQRYPRVNLIVHSLNTDEQADAIREGRVEVGFVVLPMHDESLVHEVISSVPLMVVLPEAHHMNTRKAIRLAELAHEPFILSPSDHRCGLLDNVLTVCRWAGFRPHVAQEAREMQLMLSFIAEGMGVSLLPAYVENLRKPGIIFRPIAETDAQVNLATAWRRDSASVLVRIFLDIVREIKIEPEPRSVEKLYLS